MNLIADILMVSATIGAGLYCVVLSRRLNRFTNLEQGVGGAIAVLSTQVDDMTKALDEARLATNSSASSLTELTGRAEGAAQRLELLVASMHDLPASGGTAHSTDQTETISADKTVFQSRRMMNEAAE